MANRFANAVKKINKAPQFLRSFLLTKLFCSQVKFAGTVGIKIVSVSHNKVEIDLVNKKKVQNHIGGVHAVAAALLAESATGIVFGINVPNKCVPLLKTMTIQYQRRMQGDLKAIACLDNNTINNITMNEKGSCTVAVEITDESNQQPIVCQMEWAWVTKKEK
jgi:acyl-coenzyme A thioesterase PaaI-like protein